MLDYSLKQVSLILEDKLMHQRFSIAFLAAERPSWCDADVTYLSFLMQALRDFGHQVTLDEGSIADPTHVANAEIVVVVIDRHGPKPSFIEDVQALADQRLTVLLDVDAPNTLTRMVGPACDPVLRTLIPRFDLVLVNEGGTAVHRAYTALGARECISVPHAADLAWSFPVTPRRRFQCDLGLLVDRTVSQSRIEEFFLIPASNLPHRSFLLAGDCWTEGDLPENVECVGPIDARDRNALYASPLAVLHLSPDSAARFGFSPTAQLFQAAAAGACVIIEACKGIEVFFESDREILVAESGEEVAWLLAELTPERAAGIGHAARQRLLSEHTFAHRGETLTSTFEARCSLQTLQPESAQP